MKVFLESIFPVCENNAYYLTQIFNFLKNNNIELVKNSFKADVIIMVTCGFDDERESDSLKVINDYLNKYRNKKRIIVTGCLPKINPKSLNIPGLTTISLQDFALFNEIFNSKTEIQKIKANKLNKDILKDSIKRRDFCFSKEQTSLHKDYYIQICQGCVNNCSYCAIKKAKGYVKSKSIQNIIDEINEGVSLGHKKFILLADDCGSYGVDINTDFADLLNKINGLKHDLKLNIHYFYPQKLVDLFDKINVDVWRKIYFMNIPFQSVSKKTLRLMNRNYNVDQILNLLVKIKKINKDIYLKTHIIFGFPQETIQETIDNLKINSFFNEIQFFLYSKKEGTEASRLHGELSEGDLMDMFKLIRDESLKFKNIKIAHTLKYMKKYLI